MNEELVMCAKINFENFLKAHPAAALSPYFLIAKAQLDEACGEIPAETAESNREVKKEKK